MSPQQDSGWTTSLCDSIPSARWRVAYLSSVDEIVPFLDRVAEGLTTLAYPPKDVYCVRLALEEALVNSIKHGHRHDPSKQVEVHFRIDFEQVVLEIEDQGEGFDPLDVPDPTAVENLERPCGRGLLLIRKYMTWVRYNETGNRLSMGKRRGDSPAARSGSST